MLIVLIVSATALYAIFKITSLRREKLERMGIKDGVYKPYREERAVPTRTKTLREEALEEEDEELRRAAATELGGEAIGAYPAPVTPTYAEHPEPAVYGVYSPSYDTTSQYSIEPPSYKPEVYAMDLRQPEAYHYEPTPAEVKPTEPPAVLPAAPRPEPPSPPKKPTPIVTKPLPSAKPKVEVPTTEPIKTTKPLVTKPLKPLITTKPIEQPSGVPVVTKPTVSVPESPKKRIVTTKPVVKTKPLSTVAAHQVTKLSCPKCEKPVQKGWVACPYCEADLNTTKPS
jgi:hypothetical protein